MDPVFQRLGDVTIQRLDKPKDKVGLQGGGDIVDDDVKEENSQPPAPPPPLDVHNVEDSQGIKRNFENLAGPSNKRTKFEFKKGTDESSIHSYSDGELSGYDSESDIESDEEGIAKSQTQESAEITSELETSADFLDKLVDDPYPNDDTEEIKTSEEIKSEVDDYEYDIKEKLKEMGEISFETVKKADKAKKSETSSENEVTVIPAKKTGIEDEINERKLSGNLRRNIREVMDETKLDESTLAAQRQEMERLRRVQEQQRILRDYQRQIQQERVISLLQGNSVPKAGTSGARIGSTVLVKLPNGQTMTKVIKKPFELVKVPKSAVPPHKSPKNLIAIKKPPGNLTPSVSIAPVMKRAMPIEQRFSDSDSDSEDAMSARAPIQKPKPKDPVTTIDISSDDDCIVVSESENDPGDDADEDPSNSGMHTNDEFNQPDEQGRVVVNVGHPDDEADVYVAPQIARIIKPHQIGGVRFLFDNVIESVNRFESSTGFGCILAHSMGLGKTLQIVCFSDIFLRHTPSRTILCIMPINTLQNWMAEYNMWLPTEDAVANSPLNAHGEVRPRNFNLHVLNDSHKTLAARAKVIHEWKTGGGVLLIGYEQYRLLSLRKHPKSRKKVPVVEPVDDDKSKLLFDEVHEALVKPGPDLVICDEGHRIKNSHASISQALKQMRTKRRVVLTGYPLQNNLMEYWCMVDFVRPNYLGTKTEFCNMFERPIQNGQCIDSTEADIKLMRYRAHVLHSLLVGFVQRRSHTVLQTALPQKEEYVLLVRMTPFQRTLYETFMNEVVRTQTVPNPLKAFAVCCKIWNHPDVLYYFLKKQAGGEAVDIDLEEVATTTTTNETTAKPKKGSKKSTAKGKNAKPAASVTPYNTSGDTTGKNNKKNSGKNNQNNQNINNNNQNQSQQVGTNETNQNYQTQNQNYPVKMEFEYSNSSGYGSNQSYSSPSFQQGQNFGESPSYPYSNQSTPSQPSYPGSDTNMYQYQQNNNSGQSYQSEPQVSFPSSQNQNFDQKPNFHNKGSDFPQTQGSSYNNANNQPNAYGQNPHNFQNQQPKGSYSQNQNNYPQNQQGSFPHSSGAYPPNDQETVRGPGNNLPSQQGSSFQNQAHSSNYGATAPYNNSSGNYNNQSGRTEYTNQGTSRHEGNKLDYSNNGKVVYQESQGYHPPQQQQQTNASQQQHQQTNVPSQNAPGYSQNPSMGYSTSNAHHAVPQTLGTAPHGHGHQQQHQTSSSFQHQNASYDMHPQNIIHPPNPDTLQNLSQGINNPQGHSQNINNPQGMARNQTIGSPQIPQPINPSHVQNSSNPPNLPQSQNSPQTPNLSHLQNVSLPQNMQQPQNILNPQNLPQPQNTLNPQNSPHPQNSYAPHMQSSQQQLCGPQSSSSPYPQHHHHHNLPENPHACPGGANSGYSPQQHHNPTMHQQTAMGHPQSIDGYSQNIGQSLTSGGHSQNVGGHPQNVGQHLQSTQHSQNTSRSQNVGNLPQGVGHPQHSTQSQNTVNQQNVGPNYNVLHGGGHQNMGSNSSMNIQQPQGAHPPHQQHIGGPSQCVRDKPQNNPLHGGVHLQSASSNSNLNMQQPQSTHPSHQHVGGPSQNVRDQPQSTSFHSRNIGGHASGHNQNAGSGHQHISSGQNIAQPQSITPSPQSVGYNQQNSGAMSSSVSGINPHTFIGTSQTTGHHQTSGHTHGIGGPYPNVNQDSHVGAHPNFRGQHSNVVDHSSIKAQNTGHSQNVVGNNPPEQSVQSLGFQNTDMHQQNVATSQKPQGCNYGYEKYSFPQNVGHSQNASNYPQSSSHCQNLDQQNAQYAGHSQHPGHPTQHGQSQTSSQPSNYANTQMSGHPPANHGHSQSSSLPPPNLGLSENPGISQNIPPSNISHASPSMPSQNVAQSQNPSNPQNGGNKYPHQNYPPQSQNYPSNVPPHYNLAPNPNPNLSAENQNYPQSVDPHNSYPTGQNNQNQPSYQSVNNDQNYQQQQSTNNYQSGSQSEYRGNQYNETQCHTNPSQNISAVNTSKNCHQNSSSFQSGQQALEYSSAQSNTYSQNQQPGYDQQQGYQHNSSNQQSGYQHQSQYPSNYQGGNNNPANQSSNNKDNKGFLQSFKQEVPQSPTQNYSVNPNQQSSQFQSPSNFQNYQNQQQSSYWNQDFGKQNEDYNFKPPFNQNYPINQSQQSWKKEDPCGNKPLPGSICPSPVKSENSCDSKPKINIISDIKLSGNSAYDMNKISILSDIKLEPKKENEEIKEEIKSEAIKNEVKQDPSDDDVKIVEATPATKPATKEDTGIPYDWAIELLKDYVPGIIENSAKMEILFCIIKESIALGDRLLVFSQSLITLDLIEQFLQMNTVPGETQNWAKNVNYYRLDGSTSALEREKLINEFNSNPKIYVFLVSTRAGSLGINLIGANRVVVLDASWNPCHDTQAVCRVYRYGQRKPCFVYRLVVDNCLEKKIYDRQINKQGMSDRVVDECNPDAHLTMKDVSTLCWDDKTEEGEEKDWSHCKDNYIDVVLQKVLVQYGKRLNKEPFQHESLLVDRKDKQLSQQEKRLAKKGYEREKQAARQPSYNVGAMSRGHRPVASVRPMQQAGERPTRWIPAEHWQRQGMTAQEMTLPLDVVIPTNQPDKGNIVLKAGQKVLVLKSPKGVYMQLESGKIVAIKTAIKVRGKVDEDAAKAKTAIKNNAAISVMPQKRVVKPFTPNLTKLSVKSIKQNVPNLVSRMQTVAKRVQTAKTKPYNVGQEVAKAMNQGKSETESHPSSSDEERTHPSENRHFNFSKEGPGFNSIDSRVKSSAQSSRNSSLERREMSTDGEDTVPPVVIAPTPKPRNVKKGTVKGTSSALEKLEQSASTIMAKNKQTFQESLDTITSTYGEEEKLSENSQSAPIQSSQSISSSSEPEVIPVDDTPYTDTETPTTSATTTATEVPKSDIPAPADYGYNYYGGYGHGHMPYPPPPQGYPGYPPQPYDMMGYQQPQFNYGMYPPQGYPPPPQGYPQGPYDYQPPPPPHPQAPVYPGYPPYPPQQYPPPPQGMYPPPGAPPPAPGYEYGYGAPHSGPPPPAAPYYPGH